MCRHPGAWTVSITLNAFRKSCGTWRSKSASSGTPKPMWRGRQSRSCDARLSASENLSDGRRHLSVTFDKPGKYAVLVTVRGDKTCDVGLYVMTVEQGARQWISF